MDTNDVVRRQRNPEYRAHTADADPDEIRRAFETRYGAPPVEVLESGPIVLVGPIPER